MGVGDIFYKIRIGRLNSIDDDFGVYQASCRQKDHMVPAPKQRLSVCRYLPIFEKSILNCIISSFQTNESRYSIAQTSYL
jgi:hypothetical protein